MKRIGDVAMVSWGRERWRIEAYFVHSSGDIEVPERWSSARGALRLSLRCAQLWSLPFSSGHQAGGGGTGAPLPAVSLRSPHPNTFNLQCED